MGILNFKTEGALTENDKFIQDRNIYLKGNPINLICLNIPSYMGGGSNPWATSKGKIGLLSKIHKK